MGESYLSWPEPEFGSAKRRWLASPKRKRMFCGKYFKSEEKFSRMNQRFQWWSFYPTWIVELPVLWVLANAILVLGWQCPSLSFVLILLSFLCICVLLYLNKKHPKRKAAVKMNLRRLVLISAIFWLYASTSFRLTESFH